ncbi:response regulator transcription factor [Silvimonas amylolytica]|uniref:DNA-binding response regulator n=1 Tax=Silvimonas amylolytica TaxID=449663 RepID=A0ABQ2PMS3_9NEIS|nr:response regulator transcription factor [Silvimonas amylolytica]GGP26511.1 DNA-binding response regulator [Silvimonas amylolytica]
MRAEMTIEVEVAHCDPVIAYGLMAILAGVPGINARMRASGGEASLDMMKADVLIADYDFATQFIRRHKGSAWYPTRAPRVLVMTARDLEWDVHQAMSVGVHGYMICNCDAPELIAAVEKLVEGSPYVCKSIAQKLVNSLGHEALTQREMDVLQNVALGLGNQAIAEALGISAGTIKTHVSAILSKLRAATRTEAVAIARARGLIGVPGLRHAAPVLSAGALASMPAPRLDRTGIASPY